MTKKEIAKLPQAEQDFIYAYGLENETLEDIRFIEENFNYCVYKGWV